jgi:hypothetical protein
MTIQEISDKLRTGTYTPGELADFQVQLAGEFAFIAARLEDILKAKPSIWLELRKESKSDAQADKKWQSSLMGLKRLSTSLSRRLSLR